MDLSQLLLHPHPVLLHLQRELRQPGLQAMRPRLLHRQPTLLQLPQATQEHQLPFEARRVQRYVSDSEVHS